MKNAVEPDLEVTSRLAGVITLSLAGRGPKVAFVFDPHRLALPCWALAAHGSAPALLITLDRHFDLVPPKVKTPPGLSVLELDAHARRALDVRNYDHILAALDAGVITDVIAIARASPVGSFEGSLWQGHQLVRGRTVDSFSADFGTERASPEAKQALALISQAPRIVLDVDLDCFTSSSDADPTTVLPWPQSVIREYLMPLGSEAFWAAVLPKCVALTLAREPNHCGGLIAGARLFEAAAQVLFTELLHTDLP
jgi:hypothetical protein